METFDLNEYLDFADHNDHELDRALLCPRSGKVYPLLWSEIDFDNLLVEENFIEGTICASELYDVNTGECNSDNEVLCKAWESFLGANGYDKEGNKWDINRDILRNLVYNFEFDDLMALHINEDQMPYADIGTDIFLLVRKSEWSEDLLIPYRTPGSTYDDYESEEE